MAEFIIEYGLFLAKTVTIVIAIVIIIVLVFSQSGKSKSKGKERLEIKKLNNKYEEMAHILKMEILPKEELKQAFKKEKQQHKAEKKKEAAGVHKKRLFVLNFDGDIKASALSSLREEITAVLTVATPEDEVFVRLQSGGGLVHAYGLAASQLLRLKNHNISITVSVDKVAASGGYMMACVANHIVAAPFAVLGSIGVLAQVPNFNRLLKKSNIDYEQFTAGEFKRTVTMFGENTDTARAKFREELEDTHLLFKEFVSQNRPQLDISRVSTGEHWLGIRAKELNLVDELATSDDYLLEKSKEADLYEITYSTKKSLGSRLSSFMHHTMERLLFSWQQSDQKHLL